MEAIIVGVPLTILGVFLLVSGIRGAQFLYRPPKRAFGRIVHQGIYKNFGEKGLRNYATGAGIVVMGIGLGMTFLPKIATLSPSGKKRPTISFTGIMPNPMNPDEQIEGTISLAGDIRDAILQDDDKNITAGTVASAKLREVPDKVWNMKNIRSLDLSDNRLLSIKVDSLQSLDSLRFLRLSGNPLDTAYVEGLRQQFPAIKIEF